MAAELNQTSLKVTIPDFHDGHDAEQFLSIFELDYTLPQATPERPHRQVAIFPIRKLTQNSWLY